MYANTKYGIAEFIKSLICHSLWRKMIATEGITQNTSFIRKYLWSTEKVLNQRLLFCTSHKASEVNKAMYESPSLALETM